MLSAVAKFYIIRWLSSFFCLNYGDVRYFRDVLRRVISNNDSDSRLGAGGDIISLYLNIDFVAKTPLLRFPQKR